MALAVDLTRPVCEAINKGLGEAYTPLPAPTNDLTFGFMLALPNAKFSTANGCAACVGKPFLCLRNASSTLFFYYHVLAVR